jgi:hypothetical protein
MNMEQSHALNLKMPMGKFITIGYPLLGCGKLTSKEIHFHEHAETKIRGRGITIYPTKPRRYLRVKR